MRGRLPGGDLAAELGTLVPADHARQAHADRYVPALAAAGPRVLDLGCGEGRSVDLFRAQRADVDWTGVDLADSPEVARRTRADARFLAFDGVRIPLDAGAADAILCRQVLEHVERPRELVADAARVLRPGGLIGGSTSQLEPYHSRSTANPTPYGLARLLAGAGLEVLELRPGIDGATLLARRLLGMPRSFDRFFTGTSPLNAALEAAGRALGAGARERNAAKLVLCGHVCFLARRPA